jgi:DNA helicase-2/ATP-dependent DNA helicase PcrA
MEEGLCPSERCLGNAEDIEEERRLVYVGITRAKKQLVLLAAKRRTLYGRTQFGQLSRFIRDIPESVITENTIKTSAYQFNKDIYSKKQMMTHDDLKTGQQKASVLNKKTEKLVTGMRVSHRIFGTGVVESVTAMGGDRLLVIRFDAVGTKKLMETYAQLKII